MSIPGINTGRFADRSPILASAGKVTADLSNTAAATFAAHQLPRPSTPPEIRKYRKSFNDAPGQIVVHPGRADDPPHPSNAVFGAKNVANAKASELVNPAPKSYIQSYQEKVSEAIYKSGQREPLGKPMPHHYKMPEFMQDASFKFGEPSLRVGAPPEPSAKEVIFPVEADVLESEEEHAKYVLTHSDYAPGEQRRRNYDWEAAGVDPTKAKFGRKNNIIPNGAGQCVNPELDPSLASLKTHIVPVLVDQHQRATKDELGKTKNLGLGRQGLPEDHVYGLPSSKLAVRSKLTGDNKNDWSAVDCIRGAYAEADQQPDADLGKSLRPGFRNATSEKRAFGVPSIRNDISAPRTRSVADIQNYGTEPSGVQVIFPPRFAANGVFEDDFQKPRSREELQDIAAKSGVCPDADLFEQAYALVLKTASDARIDLKYGVSLDQFRRALTLL